jgi:hypothetical protein
MRLPGVFACGEPHARKRKAAGERGGLRREEGRVRLSGLVELVRLVELDEGVRQLPLRTNDLEAVALEFVRGRSALAERLALQHELTKLCGQHVDVHGHSFTRGAPARQGACRCFYSAVNHRAQQDAANLSCPDATPWAASGGCPRPRPVGTWPSCPGRTRSSCQVCDVSSTGIQPGLGRGPLSRAPAKTSRQPLPRRPEASAGVAALAGGELTLAGTRQRPRQRGTEPALTAPP